MKYLFAIGILLSMFSCSAPLQTTEDVLGDSVKVKQHLDYLSTYIIKKQTEFSDSAWFSDSLNAYKQRMLQKHDVSYLYAERAGDTVFYIVQRKELGREFENYRLLGGKYIWNTDPQFLKELFISIRYNKEDLHKVIPSLLPYLHTENVLALHTMKQDTLIQWPEKGVFYNAHTHTWDIGEENEFYFLQKMRDSIR